jgi:hypothetical protein
VSYVTILHAAKATESIYGNDDFDDFTLTGGFFDTKNDDRLGWAKDGDAGGASGGLYRYIVNPNHFILCFRGSMGSKDFKVDDAQIVMNKIKATRVDRVDDCIAYAMQVKGQHPGASILVTGHSLGGFLAQVVGVKCDLPFITFNAPGASNFLKGNAAFKNKTNTKFQNGVNFRVSWDPVSSGAGDHIGPLITLPHHGWNVFDAHMGVAYLKSVERSVYKDKPAIAYVNIQTGRLK